MKITGWNSCTPLREVSISIRRFSRNSQLLRNINVKICFSKFYLIQSRNVERTGWFNIKYFYKWTITNIVRARNFYILIKYFNVGKIPYASIKAALKQ